MSAASPAVVPTPRFWRRLGRWLTAREGVHPALRLGRMGAGFGLLGGGVLLLVLPGPGWLTILLGLALLALEFTWAERLRQRLLALVALAKHWLRGRGVGPRAGPMTPPAGHDLAR